MLSIDSDTFLKIKPKFYKSPRDIYLVGSLDLVRKHFKNAYVIPSVNWGSLYPIYKFIVGDDPAIRYVKNFPKNRHQYVNYNEEAVNEIKKLFTVVPFTPVKDWTFKIDSWKLSGDENLLKNSEKKNRPPYMFRNDNQRSKFFSVLFQNSNAMSIYIRGVEYSSPCEFCKSLFSRVTNQCEIYNTENYVKQTCKPRVHFASHMFSEEKEDLIPNLEYSRILLEGSINV